MGKLIDTMASPAGTDKTGKAWKNFQDVVKAGCCPQLVVKSAFSAYAVEYGKGMGETLVDTGVGLVFEKVQSAKSDIRNSMQMALQSIELKKCIARHQANSFFTDLAVSSGLTVLAKSQGNNRMQAFSVEFATSILSYLIMRDLPITMGHVGLTNFYSVDGVLERVRAYIQSVAGARTFESPSELRHFLMSLGG